MSTYTDLVEGFKRMGMSADMARLAALGRDGVPDVPAGVSEVEAAFRNSGLSEAAAHYAAEGRGGPDDLTTPAAPVTGSDRLSEAEAKALLERGERLVAAGRAAVAGGRSVTLTEGAK